MNKAWIILLAYFTCSHAYSYHIILDPAGDSKNPGRTLATCYERSVTLQLCEAIKSACINQDASCTVTITRATGEMVTQEQRAQIANKNNADLFVHVSCFEDTDIKPHFMIYYHTHSDNVATVRAPYNTLIPASTAHDAVFATTKNTVDYLYTYVRTHDILHAIEAPRAIPDARLKYIQIPSCTIEIGVSHTFPWTTCVDTLSAALIANMYHSTRNT